MGSKLDIRKMLAPSSIYSLFRKFVGTDRTRSEYVKTYIRPQPSQRIFDIGCGTDDMLNYLPPVDYIGFDISQR